LTEEYLTKETINSKKLKACVGSCCKYTEWSNSQIFWFLYCTTYSWWDTE